MSESVNVKHLTECQAYGKCLIIDIINSIAVITKALLNLTLKNNMKNMYKKKKGRTHVGWSPITPLSESGSWQRVFSLFFPLVNLATNFIHFLTIPSLFCPLSVSAQFQLSTKVSCTGSSLFQLRQVEIYIPNFKPFSQVAQRERIYLSMQETQVQSPMQEDPACCGATKPVNPNY